MVSWCSVLGVLLGCLVLFYVHLFSSLIWGHGLVILAGGDINLVKILVQAPELKGTRLLDCGDDLTVVLKDADPRLTQADQDPDL